MSADPCLIRTQFAAVIGACLLFATSLVSGAESLNVAVASNFADTLRILSQQFTATTGHPVRIMSASTGKLYVQVVNGAPFDVLLAADVERPARLVASQLAVADSRFTYAYGRLALWSRDPELKSQDCLAALRADGTARVAIANPLTAPYGLAAREALQALGIWEQVELRIVQGENIAQALHFAASGNARFGIVALAQLQNESLPVTGCAWTLPPAAHSEIAQQAVLLSRAADNPLAVEFLHFLKGPDAQRVIVERGYSLPGLKDQ